MSFILPVKRLHETDNLLAFYHPEPAYPVHILLVPKKKITNLAGLEEADNDFLVDVFRSTQILVERLNLSDTGYRLVLNGGKYQDFPHLHFHLISNEQGDPDHIAPDPGTLDKFGV